MSHQLNLSRRALLASAAIGVAFATVLAVLLPSSGTAGIPTTTTTVPPPPTCDGETADIVLEEPGQFVGTAAPEVIVGSDGDDSIRGTKGNDTICGRRGDDHINGGADKDHIRGDDGEDLLRGRAGTDRMVGGFDEDQFKRGGGGGDNEDDRCFGGQPVPDLGPKGDTASQCEDIKSARIIDIEN